MKVKRRHTDYGFGFPVVLLNVEMKEVRGHWTPTVNYKQLASNVLLQLCQKESRLTGCELRFIRQHFGMTLQAFAGRFSVTHAAVIKWEKSEKNSTSMNWATEKDVRLFVLTKLSPRPNELMSLYGFLEQEMPSEPTQIEVDAAKLAA